MLDPITKLEQQIETTCGIKCHISVPTNGSVDIRFVHIIIESINDEKKALKFYTLLTETKDELYKQELNLNKDKSIPVAADGKLCNITLSTDSWGILYKKIKSVIEEEKEANRNNGIIASLIANLLQLLQNHDNIKKQPAANASSFKPKP